MSQLKILYLEATEADAESIGSIVNIVREVQSGHAVTSVARASTALRLAEPAAESPAPPLALPAKTPRKYKARAPKAAKPEPVKVGRVSGIGDQIVDAFRASTTPDRKQLARQLYGDDGTTAVNRINRAVWQLATKGRLKALGDGAYKAIG